MLTNLPKKITRDWLDESGKQLEVARELRYSHPQMCISIILNTLGELLKRLPEA